MFKNYEPFEGEKMAAVCIGVAIVITAFGTWVVNMS